MKVSVTGMTLWSAATAIEYAFGVGEAEPAGVQQHRQVVEHVGGLLGHALVGLLAGRAGDLLGLLLDLGADQRGVGEQLGGVGAFRRVGLRASTVRSSTGSASCGAAGSSSPLWKQVRSPVWQAGPAGSTSARIASASQS